MNKKEQEQAQEQEQRKGSTKVREIQKSAHHSFSTSLALSLSLPLYPHLSFFCVVLLRPVPDHFLCFVHTHPTPSHAFARTKHARAFDPQLWLFIIVNPPLTAHFARLFFSPSACSQLCSLFLSTHDGPFTQRRIQCANPGLDFICLFFDLFAIFCFFGLVWCGC